MKNKMEKTKEILPFSRVCANCMDFDSEKNVCTIRYVIHNDKDKTRSPMPRKPNQRGCEVFILK